ncbi:heme exporter protein CcmB [Ahniella affigens]|uniref:heme exporter protein CcmB n=1 Tax=Ahniella affigens TaxID=2021234 RepID=UPI00197E14D7|nr:heme exporter protein CcmB [Ahniella affigens]
MSDAVIWPLLKRDALLLFRRRSETLAPLWFALIVATAFPLALGPEAAKLTRIAGGVAWVIFLLASLLSLDALFRSDVEDGSLDVMLASRRSLTLIVACKMLLNWLGTALPLLLLTPVIAYAYDLDQGALPVLLLSLLLGTPIICTFGALAAALTAHLRRGGVLLSLIVLPLTLPVLIFGAGAVEAVITGGSARQPLLFLAAGAVVTVAFGPWLVAETLKTG